MSIRTIKVCDDKYEFDLDPDKWELVAARRNGVDWPAGFENNRFSKSFMAMLRLIADQEDEIARLRERVGR